jgi:hypothetical protein
MKKIIYTVLPLAMLAQSCVSNLVSKKGNGQMKTESRELAAFHAIELIGEGKVIIEQGAGSVVTLTGDENLLAEVNTKVKDGVLVIKPRENQHLRFSKDLVLVIRTPNLDDISMTGNGDITNKGILNCGDLDVSLTGIGNIQLKGTAQKLDASLTGTGDMTLDFDSKELEVSVTGTGDVRLMGRTDAADLQVTGTGDIDATGLQSGTMNSQTTGLGKIKTGK